MRTFALSRFLFVLLGSVALVMFVIAGCGDDAGTPTAAPTAPTEPAPAPEPQPPEPPEPQPAPAPEPAPPPEPSPAPEPSPPEPPPPPDPGEITVVTHDSFAVSEGIIESFEESTGITVNLLTGEDTGSMLSQVILTKDNPIADVMFGIDNTFLQRALDEDLFVAYRSPAVESVPAELQLDPQDRVTPIDYGDVCVNYWIDATDGPPPGSLEDLADPRHAGSFVTQNPETSSPGLAFLLATVAAYGTDGWEDYWARLRDGGVSVTAGWSEAYFGEFVAGGGERALVTSYATSPVAEVLFADPPTDTPPTGVLTDGCFRQIEFAGILAGTGNLTGAQAFVDFMLSDTFQEDIPLNMFVFPASSAAQVPEVFSTHAVAVAEPLSLDPALIAAERDNWTRRWVEIVLR
ncbi:MAG: thiamine ABC transporter substrate-binding protein [Acidimicrobiia bacterium]|nr:thiamine ABC transporter substrate-binding protein [Acidimicrobiia bacterium]MYI19656.1 thiamine ABC transporter substrate-binding protein [Acidimicrobiia bacterium]